MNQTEIKELFLWCENNLKGFTSTDVDESQHYYINDTLIGGWAGDQQAFFYEQSNELAAAIRMMDAAKMYDNEPGMGY